MNPSDDINQTNLVFDLFISSLLEAIQLLISDMHDSILDVAILMSCIDNVCTSDCCLHKSSAFNHVKQQCQQVAQYR